MRRREALRRWGSAVGAHELLGVQILEHRHEALEQVLALHLLELALLEQLGERELARLG